MRDYDSLLNHLYENLDSQGSENMDDVALYERLKRQAEIDNECEMGG